MADDERKSDAEWRELLTPEQYRVTREKGTEPPFTGEYCDTKSEGMYACVCCGAPLFSSETKFASGSGWPSFTAPLSPDTVKEELDLSHFMRRIEISCHACGAHLGHVFPDGPGPGGLRYCVNSVALRLEAREDEATDGDGENGTGGDTIRTPGSRE
jgi:peptide-methionine (R)-S-oxide reductase